MSGIRLVTLTFPVDKGGRKSKLVRRGTSQAPKPASFSAAKLVAHSSSNTSEDGPVGESFAKDLYDMLVENLYAIDPSWEIGRTHHTIKFRSRGKEVRRVLEAINHVGVGVDFGRIDLTDISATIPGISAPKTADTAEKQGVERRKKSCFPDCLGLKGKKFVSNDRMSTEEISSQVDGGIHLTCEYLMLCLVAGLIACVGLRRNSATTVISSMLVSPLMGPILGITYGAAIRDMGMVGRSLRNEIIGMVLCILEGVLVALIDSSTNGMAEIDDMLHANSTNRNLEMLSRTAREDLIWGLFVAIPSGVGVALAISNGGINALVGVAISAALLPPLCNAGLLFVYCSKGDSCDSELGLNSLYLFLMNFGCIILFGYITFKVKGVRKQTKRSDYWKQMLPDLENGELHDIDARNTSNVQLTTIDDADDRIKSRLNSWVFAGENGDRN